MLEQDPLGTRAHNFGVLSIALMGETMEWTAKVHSPAKIIWFMDCVKSETSLETLWGGLGYNGENKIKSFHHVGSLVLPVSSVDEAQGRSWCGNGTQGFWSNGGWSRDLWVPNWEEWSLKANHVMVISKLVLLHLNLALQLEIHEAPHNTHRVWVWVRENIGYRFRECKYRSDTRGPKRSTVQ